MTEVVKIGNAELHLGDCLEVLRTLPDASIEAIVTDPPAGIGFMGKDWDHHKGGRQQWVAWMTDIAAECLRVLKPGGHALVWAIPRTSHWTATAWEDAGFEIRDRIAHCFGGGFPKSMDVSKALDKMAGAERERVAGPKSGGMAALNKGNATHGYRDAAYYDDGNMMLSNDPVTPTAKQWAGWGTALKPAIEDWWLCRKPLDGTVAGNVLKHGCGGLNIDASRVACEANDRTDRVGGTAPKFGTNTFATDRYSVNVKGSNSPASPAGRFPANLIHDGSDEVVWLFHDTGASPKPYTKKKAGWLPPGGAHEENSLQSREYGDTGSAARFFKCCPMDDPEAEVARFAYVPKASKADRDEGCEGLEERFAPAMGNGIGGKEHDPETATPKRNHHPTVKATALMRYLCRLITPPGGTVLDPFMGSGSTGKAAMLEGFRFIGIEREAEYLAIAKARISATQRQPDLFHQEAP